MSRHLKMVVLSLVAVVVVIVVVVAAYLLTREDAPEAVDLETAVARIEAAETGDRDAGPSTTGATADTDTSTAGPTTDSETDTSTAGPTADVDAGTSTASAGTGGDEGVTTAPSGDNPSDAGAPTDGSASADAAPADQTADSPGGLDGVWAVQVAGNAGDLQGEPTVSFAGFRVDEVLAGGIGDFTAVGRTADVSGSIELAGNVLVAATVEVTMSTLRTDNSSRDSQARRALNTNEFPVATFTLVEPVELPAGMAGGEALSGSAHGDLTIKGTTNRATFDLQAQMLGDTIVAVGSSDVVFSDYGVTAPTAPIVVSVEDHGIMEFQLIFTR